MKEMLVRLSLLLLSANPAAVSARLNSSQSLAAAREIACTFTRVAVGTSIDTSPVRVATTALSVQLTRIDDGEAEVVTPDPAGGARRFDVIESRSPTRLDFLGIAADGSSWALSILDRAASAARFRAVLSEHAGTTNRGAAVEGRQYYGFCQASADSPVLPPGR